MLRAYSRTTCWNPPQVPRSGTSPTRAWRIAASAPSRLRYGLPGAIQRASKASRHADLGSRRRRSASTRRQRSRRGAVVVDGSGDRLVRLIVRQVIPDHPALARQQSSRPARCRERRASTRTIRRRGAGVGWRPGDRPQRPRPRTAPSRGPQAVAGRPPALSRSCPDNYAERSRRRTSTVPSTTLVA
jgi:hypothetical protein